MWELNHKEGWTPKNWWFWTVVLEKTLESPLDCKEIQPVHPKGNQSWIFTERTDAEAPILWPPDVKNWLIRKDPDAGRDKRWGEEKGTTEDGMVGWHQGDEFEQAPRVGEGQRSLVDCSPWGGKESDTSEWLNNSCLGIGEMASRNVKNKIRKNWALRKNLRRNSQQQTWKKECERWGETRRTERPEKPASRLCWALPGADALPSLCDPMDCSPPGSSVHGVFQARELEWFVTSSSRGSSWPTDRTSTSWVSCIGRQILKLMSNQGAPPGCLSGRWGAQTFPTGFIMPIWKQSSATGLLGSTYRNLGEIQARSVECGRVCCLSFLSFCLQGFSGGSAGKESAWNVGDLGWIPRLGRSPGEGNGYPLQYWGDFAIFVNIYSFQVHRS